MKLDRLELDGFTVLGLAVLVGGCGFWLGFRFGKTHAARLFRQRYDSLSKREPRESELACRQGMTKKDILGQEAGTRIWEQTADLQQAVGELKAFVPIVAHDLKSPLRSIIGYCKFIFEDHGAALDAELVQKVAAIYTIGSDTISLIDRLLYYCKTTDQELIWEEINPAILIKEICAELQAGAAGQELVLMWETALPQIRGDRLLVKEVFVNVLANSLKFSRGRERTVITVGCRLAPSECQIYIRDNGVGFDMEFCGKLFGIFERLHTADEFEGSGIGLATVQKIMQRHGGRARIEGEVDVGTTVYLIFPIEQEGIGPF
jgi:two-component system sensor histidine kinase/response regulator